ncbi:MAG TPA: DUF4388 domain-containing protein [Myxococcales bacterium]|nr:DUF4388 domain-containing protein [Myxococcales bacterium]
MDHRSFHLAAVHELVDGVAGFAPVLWGELSGLPLSDLLNVLGHGQRTGLLLVRGHDASERALGVVRGNITWAASSIPGERDFREVAFGMVRLQNGQFTFLRAPDGALPEAESASATELLLEGMRRLDEESRVAHPRRGC